MLDAVLPILHELRPGPDWWSFGGGTALAVHLGHRVSYDIDLFLDSSRDLRALTPQRNPRITALLGNPPMKYEYPGSYLKLTQEDGEIDFIVATPQTDPGYVAWSHGGYPVHLETPVEIAIKKLFYRPSTFKIRDVFDVAAVLERYPAELDAALPLVADRLDKVIDRIEALAPSYAVQVLADVNPTEQGQGWLDPERSLCPLLTYLRVYRKTLPG
jgi:hypothetical protein